MTEIVFEESLKKCNAHVKTHVKEETLLKWHIASKRQWAICDLLNSRTHRNQRSAMNLERVESDEGFSIGTERGGM